MNFPLRSCCGNSGLCKLVSFPIVAIYTVIWAASTRKTSTFTEEHLICTMHMLNGTLFPVLLHFSTLVIVHLTCSANLLKAKLFNFLNACFQSTSSSNSCIKSLFCFCHTRHTVHFTFSFIIGFANEYNFEGLACNAVSTASVLTN